MKLCQPGLLSERLSAMIFEKNREPLTARIGGTSTCCIPFLACIEALIRAAAAATGERSVAILWISMFFD